jgi:hypothetical protein
VTNSYERLEYLGDAVLDYLISTIIISSESLDVLDPGRITDIRYSPYQCSGSGIRCLFDPPGSGTGKKSRSGFGMSIEVFIRFKHAVFE